MNENFIRIMQDTGFSSYQLSKQSGVAYTVVNSLCRKKKQINHCSAETVIRLASALGVSFDCLIDPVSVMDGVSGTYRKIKYRWSYRDSMELKLIDGKEETVIHTGYQLHFPEDRRVYDDMTRIYIDQYLEHKEMAKRLSAYAERLQKEAR